jgi:soluble lytic murein transglycosylase-like protein
MLIRVTHYPTYPKFMRSTKRAIAYYLCIWCIVLATQGIWIVPGYAEIYKYLQNGVVHYSNLPPADARYEKFQTDNTETVLKVSPPKVKYTSSTSAVITTSKSMSSQNTSYDDLIQKIADAYQLNPALVKAIVKVESNYNHQAVSPKGAQGLMQLMPGTAKRFGVSDVFNPEENITGGAKFLRYLLDEFGEENLDLVLAGYNAGEQAIRKYGNKVPPYKETQQYIELVLSHYLPGSQARYKKALAATIYRYIDKNGVMLFTNVPKIK